MNIGCDLDGVIIDHRHNQARLLARRGFFVSPERISRELIRTLLAGEEYQDFIKELYGAMSIGADEVIGAKDSIARLLGDNHDIRIISRRNEGKPFAKKWLLERGFSSLFPDSKIHFVSADEEKDTICKQFKVDLCVDDSTEVLEKIRSPRHKILFSREVKFHPAATAVVPDWDVLVQYVDAIL